MRSEMQADPDPSQMLIAAQQREAAMREVLQVLNRSRDDEQAVFDVILDNALRLCDAQLGLLFLNEEGDTHQKMVAQRGGRSKWVGMFQTDPTPLDAQQSLTAKSSLEKVVVQIEDVADTDLYRQGQRQRVVAVDEEGVRTCLAVPLIGERIHAGSICIYRREVKPFTDSEIDLVRAFAEHAVNAIENARQSREVQTRLEREQATREILQVISQSRDDDAPVFDLILKVVLKLCDAEFGAIFVYEPGDTHVNLAADRGYSPRVREMYQNDPPPMDPAQSMIARCILSQEVVHVDLADPDIYPGGSRFGAIPREEGRMRRTVLTPMIIDDRCVGVLGLFRLVPDPFDDDQIELLQTFAAQAAIAVENVRTFKALENSTAEVQAKADALEDANTALNTRLHREEATREILEVISQNRSDEQPVFDVILRRATKLCDAPLALLGMIDRENACYRPVADIGASPDYLQFLSEDPPPFDPEAMIAARAMDEGRTIQVDDLTDPDLPGATHPHRLRSSELEGVRTMLMVPLMSAGQAIGCIFLYRREVKPFSEADVKLLQTFAAQAVVAIENVRQFRELQTRLEREGATGEVLSVISQSRDDEGPVFETILSQASRLCDAPLGGLILGTTEDTHLRLGAAIRAGPAADKMFRDDPPPMDPDVSVNAQVIVSAKTLHLPDLAATELYKAGHRHVVTNVDEIGIRSYLAVPLLSGGRAIGLIGLYRKVVQPFTPDQIALVETFAAQAVIAIENVRQFRELQSRLEREEASREILSVISHSRDDEAPVFDVILEQACRLCDAPYAGVMIPRQGDTHLHVAAHKGITPEWAEKLRADPSPMDANKSYAARSILEQRIVHIENQAESEIYKSGGSYVAHGVEEGGMRTSLYVPLVSKGVAIGCLCVFRREIKKFSEDQIALISTFAAQAVIAIENVRQFRALQSQLERTEATGKILSAISQSREDEKAVFDTILGQASRLCDAPLAALTMGTAQDSHVRLAAHIGAMPEQLEMFQNDPPPMDPKLSVAARSIIDMKTIHVRDMVETEVYKSGSRFVANTVDQGGMRTCLWVPLRSGGQAIGAIALYRRAVQPFTDEQIALVETFAAQAVIAVENVRQFRELQTRLEREAASREILGVISQSRDDDQPVFDVILKKACQLCDAPFAALIQGRKDDVFQRVVAEIGDSPETIELYETRQVPMDPDLSYAAMAIAECKVIHLPDMGESELYKNPDSVARALVEKEGVRTVLFVPLIANGEAIGVITLFRREVDPFADQNIDLVETFASQAVIAIENVRQLKALVEARDAAEAALTDLKKAQERLVQSEKMASLGQLTAGIAHEIKNPLNFVNNFAKLSDELLGELAEILADPIQSLGEDDREDAEDLMQTVRENLGKINQHGRRADSIIKNMLLHSREGAAERQTANVNNIAAEALNLAYHGARAENSSFNIDMQTDYAEDAGQIECYAQDLMRVFLNIISNGMYAAYKRSLTEPQFAPSIIVSSRRMNDRVEVEIRDNGMGMPVEIREQIFAPFFTTKPAGEGTGLGLSLSYDIVVKQHGGELTVDSQPGEFTVFKISLPTTLPTETGVN